MSADRDAGRTPPVTPAVTLAEIYGGKHAHLSLYHPDASGWFLRTPYILSLVTGAQIAVAGDAPLLCDIRVASPRALDLMRLAGLQIAQRLLPYRDMEVLRADLHRVTDEGFKVACITRLPDGMLTPEQYSVPLATLSFLNNKANLGALVPAAHLPQRAIVAHAELEVYCRSSAALPRVVKAATDGATGAGQDVAVCRSAKDLARASRRFAACSQVVVEEFLEIDRNLCLGYAATQDGRILYLGAAEQVSDPDGTYRGNWIDPGVVAPEAAIGTGHEIARRGIERGFVGCLGLDIATLPDGRFLVFDLNFRTNGSTTPLLLHAGLASRFGARIARFRRLQGTEEFDTLARATAKAIEGAYLVPICIFDPEAGDATNGFPALQALILGDSREEVAERERELAAAGLG